MKPDTLKTITDTLKVKSDTLTKKSQIDFPAFSVARDSIVEDFRNGRKMIYYYGDVKVNYENIELTAEYMEYDLDSKTVFATGIKDSTGAVIGRPVLTEGSSKYEMEKVYYNFASRKARITNKIGRAPV